MNKMMDKIQLISVDKLFVNEVYQRDLKRNNVRKMVANWDEDQNIPILVNLRKNGTYSIIDGQHRFLAMKALGVEFIICIVLEHKTVEREAQLFKELNVNRAKPTPLDLFKAGIAAQEDLYLRIEGIVRKYGFDFPFVSPSGTTPKTGRSIDNQIFAVNTLKRMCDDRNKTNGFEILDSTLEMIRLLWSDNREALKNDIISGMSRFIKGMDNVENFNRSRFIEKVGRKSPQEIRRNAAIYKIKYNGELETNVVFALVDAYNHGLSHANKLQAGDILQKTYNFVERD